ncbi:pyridoxal phosphate-dependent transferase [Lactarius akahatsu]|uniref:histidinol-phosphate transaminase n=1 Tax=Lactarius akahatsu TaxID=416441 RepID=A0AAD4LPV5_9AGAM|nr:pyridoxal phosphate-dependent transferase [Lactarius akahatsu]
MTRDGSDEVINLLVCICVTPGGEKIIYLDLSADGSEGGDKGRFRLRVGERRLFNRSVEQVKGAINENSSIKIIFLCSPGNPTGTLISLGSTRAILDYEPIKGIVVVDAAKDGAYIDFPRTWEQHRNAYHTEQELWARGNLVHTALCSPRAFFIHPPRRLGIALAQPLLIQILSNTKAPYNISTPTAHLALHALSPASLRTMNANIERIKVSRAALLSELHDLRDLGLGSAIGVQDATLS